MSQLAFLKKPSKEFGGSLLKGRRKTARVLDSKRPLHFVLKSNKVFAIYKHRRSLKQLLKYYSQKFGIKVYSESVQKDHWHLCLKITDRNLYKGFIRALTGTIARDLGKGLWVARPYSRVVNWGRDYLNVLDYILLNQCEIKGIVPYAVRKKHIKSS